MVVLYRATGVLYLAFGAVGRWGPDRVAADQLVGVNQWLAYAACVLLVCALLTLAYGMVFGPALAGREPLVKAVATLGLTLMLLGVMDLLWTSSGGESRAITCRPTAAASWSGRSTSHWTQVIAWRPAWC